MIKAADIILSGAQSNGDGLISSTILNDGDPEALLNSKEKVILLYTTPSADVKSAGSVLDNEGSLCNLQLAEELGVTVDHSLQKLEYVGFSASGMKSTHEITDVTKLDKEGIIVDAASKATVVILDILPMFRNFANGYNIIAEANLVYNTTEGDSEVKINIAKFIKKYWFGIYKAEEAECNLISSLAVAAKNDNSHRYLQNMSAHEAAMLESFFPTSLNNLLSAMKGAELNGTEINAAADFEGAFTKVNAKMTTLGLTTTAFNTTDVDSIDMIAKLSELTTELVKKYDSIDNSLVFDTISSKHEVRNTERLSFWKSLAGGDA